MPQFSSDVPSLCKAMGKPDFRYRSFDNIAFIPQTPYVKAPVEEAEHVEASKPLPAPEVTLRPQDGSTESTALPIENFLTDARSIPLSKVFSMLEKNRITSGMPAKGLNEIFR
ncbi:MULTISPECIES: hypothetical protein [unclassified Gluconobacter]|uniref:hypothetical protein n=1 Tax=unclassified Gluconobacter TaxID=2644261 RepID=UPI0017662B79|nr:MULTISPECIES: hypothetical protein [unclassified Gluconobacter]GFE97424.1 hypothetical protein DmGdi_24970 [Gluconobacter sp. Gdi]